MLLGTAAATNFAAGVARYAMYTADSETESFNILKVVSEEMIKQILFHQF